MVSESVSQHLAEVAEVFAEHRPRMFAIAHRTLGSPWAADDAVQEAWIRLQRTDRRLIRNLDAWLTTVISRVCIDSIRHEVAQREDLHADVGGPVAEAAREPSADHTLSADQSVEESPEGDTLLSDDLALALSVILETLGPRERLSLVLHDIFALSYDDIGPIVDRTPTAARQLASRARSRLRTVDVDAVRDTGESAISAFLEAAREGDFGNLLQVLDPEIEVRSDPAAVELASAGVDVGAPLLSRRVQGGDAVARIFAGRAQATRAVRINGIPAAAYVTDGVTRAVYLPRIVDGLLVGLDILADDEVIAGLDISRNSMTSSIAHGVKR